MNISSINFVNSINVPFHGTQRKNTNNDASDTFVRSSGSRKNEPSFDDFSKWAVKTNFVNKINNIVTLSGIIFNTNTENKIISIPQNEKYAILKDHRGSFYKNGAEKPIIEEFEDLAPELNAGQVIANVVVPAENDFSNVYWIIKKPKGEKIGIDEFSLGTLSDYNIKLHKLALKKLAELPQSAYNKCIKDVKTLTDSGYGFDYIVPNNILVDNNKKQINFMGVKEDTVGKKEQYGEVLYAMLDGEFGVMYENTERNHNEKEVINNYKETIINKYFNAMKNQNAKFDKNGYIEELLNTNLLNENLKCSTTKEQLKVLSEKGLI